MKNYENMAQDVLLRIKEKEKRRRNQQVCFRSTLALTCAVVLVLTGLMMSGRGQEGSSLSSSVDGDMVAPPAEGWTSASVMQKVYLSNGGKQEVAMRVSQGIQYRLQVIDLRGLTHMQAEELCNDQRHMVTAEQDQWATEGVPLRGFVRRMENVLVSSISTVGFSLDVEDWGTVTEIRGECSSGYGQVEFALCAPALAGQSVDYMLLLEDGGSESLKKPVYDNGCCWLYGQGIALSGDVCGQDGPTIMWKPGKALLQALDAQPATPLSAFSDTLTLSVSYEDGTTETHTVRMRFSDDGVVNAVYEGVVRSE